MKILLTTILIVFAFQGNAQYAPAAGKPGSTALHKDSTIFVNWAKSCKIQRGWMNIAQKDSGYTTIGDTLSATGMAGENGVVSLGDSGVVICQFNVPLRNGEGWDFAVFENSFEDQFLELAFVEVSSDGWRYFRFPCHSLTDTTKQNTGFGLTDPTHLNNLAGKYRYSFGTPFDLDDIPEYKDLNKNAITHIKIVDVVGSLNSAFAGFDTANRKINDPWPTPFPSGGFDLDAIGVIHQQPLSGIQNQTASFYVKGPNPILDNQQLTVDSKGNGITTVVIYNIYGGLISHIKIDKDTLIQGSDLPQGLFFIQIQGVSGNYIYKGLKL